MTRRASVAKTFTFDAAHQLYNHSGKCQNLHGHTYRVEVEVSGPVQDATGKSDEGMVIDFGEVKAKWKSLEPLLDHKNLNDTIGPEIGPTTAENLAAWLFDQFEVDLPAELSISRVSVWETPSSRATVTA